MKGHNRVTNLCICNTCGSINGVLYDVHADYYICNDCIDVEQNEIDDDKKDDEDELEAEEQYNEQRYRRSLDHD